MLTEAQAVPLTSVDAAWRIEIRRVLISLTVRGLCKRFEVLAHPAILGYTVAKTQKRRTPHLYVNGSFLSLLVPAATLSAVWLSPVNLNSINMLPGRHCAS